LSDDRSAPSRADAGLRGVAVAVLSLAVSAPVVARAGPDAPDRGRTEVLVLHSYAPDYDWTRSEQAGIDAVLKPLAGSFDVRIEYMDATHSPELARGPLLRQLYREKFARSRFGVVLTTDNAAFDFLRAYGGELFPGVPVVFTGVNGFEDAMLAGHDDFTGVAEDNDFLGVIDAALRLQPGVRRMVFPGLPGDTTYQGNVALTRKQLARSPRPIQVEFPECANLEDCLAMLRRLPKDSAVAVIGNQRTAAGRGINNQRAVELLSPLVDVPIYTAWDFSIGHGAIGGSVTAGAEQGRLAAELAVRVARGERPRDLPVVRNGGNGLRFDHRQLVRFGIPRGRLPPGSVVANAPDPSYRIPRQAFWTAIGSLVLLVLAVVGLAVNVRRRQRAEAALRHANKRLEDIIEFLPDATVIVDRELDVVAWNRATVELTGIPEEEMIGKPHTAAGAAFYGVPRPLLVALLDHDDAELAAGYGYVRRTGDLIYAEAHTPALGGGAGKWVSVTVCPLRDDQGRPSGAIESIRDVTDRKRAEAMERQLVQSQRMESVGLLAGGIAHDFNNLLTPILSCADLLALELPAGDPRWEWVEDIRAAAQRASDLTRQILAFGRRQVLQLTTLDPGSVVRRF
jgi:PAS domain-containing protein